MLNLALLVLHHALLVAGIPPSSAEQEQIKTFQSNLDPIAINGRIGSRSGKPGSCNSRGVIFLGSHRLAAPVFWVWNYGGTRQIWSLLVISG